jgi:hypothetical protein
MSMPRLHGVLVLLVAALALLAAGCGGSSESEESEDATPAEAIAEIATIRTALDDAVAKVRAGDAEAAETTVGDAYLEHFEHVEDPLGERDHDLMEELEESISTDLRDQIKAGEDAAAIEASVANIKSNLDRAVEVLQAS